MGNAPEVESAVKKRQESTNRKISSRNAQKKSGKRPKKSEERGMEKYSLRSRRKKKMKPHVERSLRPKATQISSDHRKIRIRLGTGPVAVCCDGGKNKGRFFGTRRDLCMGGLFSGGGGRVENKKV